ncbi:hypothetical protein CcaCcLH18_02953 [Colletotrichum camelliae]|nr:hypothetical protein CcaCcLH18_02953 [Colletotrichum camelliae]
MSSDELPLALRRTRRSVPGAPSAASASATSPVSTPHRASKRKVRFSDPGPVSTPRTTSRLSSTGLTPMIRRTTLNKGTPTTSRRHSAPVSRTPSGSGATPSSDLPHSGEVHFLPLRQVLDGRVQRRIRRNGLSEEMNTITAEKRRRAQETRAEIDALKAQLKEKDAEIYELQNATIVIDMERIWGLEKEVETLKEQLSNRSGVNRGQSCYDWTLAARGPYVDDYMETDTIEAESVAAERMLADETAFGDATMAEFVCSTPTRVRSSFLTPPLTSPVAEGPITPSSHRGSIAPPSHCNAGVQTSFSDTEKDSLQDELTSLRLEMSKLTNTLESYTSLTTRLSDRLSAFTPSTNTTSEPLQTIEEQVTHLLRTVSDRTAALLDLNSSLSDLGFPGSDASEIITSLAASLRTARLELEYLTPGEITLPLSSHGAEVLDLLLTRLRDLAKRGKEDEAAIDEYHQLELSLRQQLGARVAAMDSLNEDLARAKAHLKQKDATAAELQVSVDRLKGAVNGYIRDVMELEGVIGKMEGENRDAMATKDAQIEVGRRVLRSKEDVIAQLETKLADAVAQTKAFRRRLDESEESRAREVASVNRRSGQALAVRDARVAELREEVERVNESLRAAHESVKNLRVEKKGLEGKMAEERVGAKKVIDQMKAELERVVSMSREFLADEVEESTTPTSTPPRAASRTPKKAMEPAAGVSKSPLAGGTVVKKGLLSGELVRRVSGRKRRKYDSGLGFLDEDEVDA